MGFLGDALPELHAAGLRGGGGVHEAVQAVPTDVTTEGGGSVQKRSASKSECNQKKLVTEL